MHVRKWLNGLRVLCGLLLLCALCASCGGGRVGPSPLADLFRDDRYEGARRAWSAADARAAVALLPAAFPGHAPPDLGPWTSLPRPILPSSHAIPSRDRRRERLDAWAGCWAGIWTETVVAAPAARGGSADSSAPNPGAPVENVVRLLAREREEQPLGSGWWLQAGVRREPLRSIRVLHLLREEDGAFFRREIRPDGAVSFLSGVWLGEREVLWLGWTESPGTGEVPVLSLERLDPGPILHVDAVTRGPSTRVSHAILYRVPCTPEDQAALR